MPLREMSRGRAEPIHRRQGRRLLVTPASRGGEDVLSDSLQDNHQINEHLTVKQQDGVVLFLLRIKLNEHV